MKVYPFDPDGSFADPRHIIPSYRKHKITD